MEASFLLFENTITNMEEEKFRMNPGVLNAIGFIGRNSWFLIYSNIYMYIERQV